jgi:hypothetical protein
MSLKVLLLARYWLKFKKRGTAGYIGKKFTQISSFAHPS